MWKLSGPGARFFAQKMDGRERNRNRGGREGGARNKKIKNAISHNKTHRERNTEKRSSTIVSARKRSVEGTTLSDGRRCC